MPRYMTCPRLLGESEGQLKAHTVAVDASRSEGHASHRVRLILVQAPTALSAQPMSAWLARPRLRQGQGVGQQNPKRGAAAGAVLHPGPPALQFDEASNQRQPDADAAGVAGMLRSLVERLEQGRPQLRWDAGAGILDRRHQQQRDRLQGPHLGRHPTATLCVFTDNFFGPWIQIDGTAEIVPLPEAIEGLVDYYRRVSGEHPDWDDYRRTMVNQRRVLIRLSIDNVGPTHAG